MGHDKHRTRNVNRVEDEIEVIDPQELGLDITRDQFYGFQLYTRGMSSSEIGSRLGLTRATIWNWKKTEWWIRMSEWYVGQRQRDIHMRMSADADELYEGYKEVVTGVDKSDKTASARVKGFEMVLTTGRDPVMNKNPQLQINNNTQTNNIMMTPGMFKGLSKEQMSEIARTGVMPIELTTARATAKDGLEVESGSWDQDE